MDAEATKEHSWAQERFAHADPLTHSIIGAAIAVHRQLGPGLLESIYHRCMMLELQVRGITFESEVLIPISYRNAILDTGLRLDLLVAGKIIVELKSVEKVLPVHESQILTFMSLAEIPIGLLINFNTNLLKDGITRRVL